MPASWLELHVRELRLLRLGISARQQLHQQNRHRFAQLPSVSGVSSSRNWVRNKATDSEETSSSNMELSAFSPLVSPLNRRAFSAPDGVHPGDPTVARDRLAIAWDLRLSGPARRSHPGPAAPAPKGWSPHRPPGPRSASGANGFGVVPVR
jgi:hypothetical protein